MSAQIIDGKEIAAMRRREIAEQVAKRLAHGRAVPGLAVILVSDDSASRI